MTKAELIERVYGQKHLPRDLTKKTVAQIVDAVFTEMGDYFIRARVSRNQAARLTYPGFGTFLKRRRPPRMVKNPATGAASGLPFRLSSERSSCPGENVMVSCWGIVIGSPVRGFLTMRGGRRRLEKVPNPG